MLNFLYSEDPTKYPNERERVQQGFFIIIHAFPGLRPSSTTRSSKGRKQDEAKETEDSEETA